MRWNHELFIKIKDVLVVLVVPILFTLLFGYVYSNVYVEEIPIAVLDLDYSTNSDLVKDSFDDSSGMQIIAEVDTQPQLEDIILSGEARGGVVIPPDFGKDVAAKKSPGLLVLIDGSNLVIGNNLYAYASTVVTTLNVGVQASILEGGGVAPYTAGQYLSTLSFTDRMLYDPQMGYFRYIFAGILCILIQQTYLSVLIPKLMEEKQRAAGILPAAPLERPAAAGRPEGGHIAVFGLTAEVLRTAAISVMAFLCCLMIGSKIYHYPLRGGMAELLLLAVCFLLGMTAAAILIAAFFDDISHCVQFSMFLSLPTFLTSGYVWPEFMMAPGFAPVVKAIWPLYYFCNPLRDVCMKGAQLAQIMPYVRGALLFAAVWLPVSVLAYRHKITVLRASGGAELAEETKKKASGGMLEGKEDAI